MAKIAPQLERLERANSVLDELVAAATENYEPQARRRRPGVSWRCLNLVNDPVSEASTATPATTCALLSPPCPTGVSSTA